MGPCFFMSRRQQSHPVMRRQSGFNNTLIISSSRLLSARLCQFRLWSIRRLASSFALGPVRSFRTDLEREMTLKTTKLRDAIVFALCVGATSLAGTGLASAQDAAAPAAPAEDATTLD